MTPESDGTDGRSSCVSRKCEEVLRCVFTPSRYYHRNTNKSILNLNKSSLSSSLSSCTRIQELVHSLRQEGLLIQPKVDINEELNEHNNLSAQEEGTDSFEIQQVDIGEGEEKLYPLEARIVIRAVSPAVDTPIHMTIPVECKLCSTDPNSAESQCRAYVSSPVSGTVDNDPPLIDGIVLCANRLETRQELEEALLHELVHVHDAFVKRLNLRRCEDLAYSEVRAAREAECNFRAIPVFMRKSCVREKATNATMCMFPGNQGRYCVNKVFDKAFADMTGFHNAGGTGSKRNECKTQQPSER